MKLSEELAWRGFVNQTTYKDATALDGAPITFYWGVDPSADSMTVGHLALAMMVRHFMSHGHRAVLLVGGATGLIGDPDGKAQERELKEPTTIAANVQGLVSQYERLFAGNDFKVVNNYDWFKDYGYLDFLRTVGKHVPMRQMLAREFVQTRLGEDGSGISYAEFSYSLIQGYDFWHLYKEHGVSLQVCGADQWGNSIAGVELVRRIGGGEAHVWSAPLVINRVTGVKFGKSEAGALWLDQAKTTPTAFYQFWINANDADAEAYLKLFTLFSPEEVATIMADQQANPGARIAQKRLAREVTATVHGASEAEVAERVTEYLTGVRPIGEADAVLASLRLELPYIRTALVGSVIDALVAGGLATSNTEARRLLAANAITINGQKLTADREAFEPSDFQNGRLLLRRGKAYKDTILVELGES